MAMRWVGDDTLQEMTMRSGPRPASMARAVESTAEITMQSSMISSELRPSCRSVFSCIFANTRSWSSDPPLTPMRTGLPLSRAIRQIVAKWSSRRAPVPTLPGLMRYLSRARAQSGCRARRRWPL